MNAFFEPEAAIAACKPEDIMSLSVSRLAQVAWPLLPDAERTLSMRDVLFTPPLRVSASPRATEAAFAAGIQACLAELTDTLARVQYGESPLSLARLRAAALQYHINESQRWTGGSDLRGAATTATATRSASSPLQMDGSATAPPLPDAEAVFDFALPSLPAADGTEAGKREDRAESPVAPRGRGAAATAIHSTSHNCPPDAASAVAAVKGGHHNTEDSHTRTGGGEAETTASTAGAPQRSASERESYERKTRSFVSTYVDTQWESVVTSALASEEKLNTAAPDGAAALRHKMLRTALALCCIAPASAAAGHSFVCLLKHALRGVSATDTIRAAEESVGGSGGDGELGAAAAAVPPASPGQTSEFSRRAKAPQTGGREGTETSPPSHTQHTEPATQQHCLLSSQASLWAEVVLPLLHCIPLVHWTDDVLVDLGQVLETVIASAPPKLIAAAQQRQQQQQRASTTTGGVHSEPARGTRCCHKRPSPSLTAATASSAAVGGTVEETVDFTVRVPFKIGLPKPALTQEELLHALYHGTSEQQQQPNTTSTAAAPPPPQQQQQLSLTNESATSATGNNDSSYPSSAFHEVPDIHDEEEQEVVTEEMSVVDEENDDDDDYTTTSGSSGNDHSASAPRTERASAVNVSDNSEDGDDVDDDEESEAAFGVLFGGPRGDFEALPCRRRRTQLVEFSFPAATRVSVRLLDGASSTIGGPRGRDVLLLPLESASASAERAGSASVTTEGVTGTAASSLVSGGKAKRFNKDALPLSLPSARGERSETLTHNGPCRVAIPSLPQGTGHAVPGEVTARLQLTLDTRRATEWATALATAQRTVAERLLGWMETRAQLAAVDETLQRRSRVASCALLRGGVRAPVAATAAATATSTECMTYAAAAASPPSAAAASSSSVGGCGTDPFVQTLLEMPLMALRARVRCHTVHVDGVRATLLLIAHAFLQDRAGYLQGDPLTWHTPAWSEAVRRVSLASNVVGAAAASGEAAMELAKYVTQNVVRSCAAATTPRAHVIDAAIDLMSLQGLSLADVKAALDDRRQASTAMWVIADLLTKCSSVSRAPKHVALVSQAARRLLLLGCAGALAVSHSASQPHVARQNTTTATTATTAAAAVSGRLPAMSNSASASTAVATAGTTVPTAATPANHYLSIVNGCGRATEINLRRGVHALLSQLFRLLKALLHRIQSTQAAPHRFLLDAWDYGAFAVFTIALMSAPLDAADVQLCAPFFADIVTGLLPSFTRLSRTESLLLTSEGDEHTFLVEVARQVRGRASYAVAGGDVETSEADSPASREPHIVRKVEETALATMGDAGGVWDVLQGATAASWTPGHVRVEVWSGSCAGFYIGLASADLPGDVSGPERDPRGIYFMGDGTLQYGDVTRKQRRLPRWHAGDVVELSFVFANGSWDVVMSLNETTMVRLTLPRRDFRLVAVNVRAGPYVPGHNHVHVLSVQPVYGRSTAGTERRRKHPLLTRATAALLSLPQGPDAATGPAAAPADVRLSPFSRLTIFNVSLFLELVLHYLVLHSSRQHYPVLVGAAAAAASTTATSAPSAGGHGGHTAAGGSLRGLPRRALSSAALALSHGGADAASASGPPSLAAGVAEGVHLVQACTAPLQHCLQQLVHLLHDLSHPSGNASPSASTATAGSKGNSDSEAEADEVKRVAAQHITNAMLLDLVVTVSISLPSSTASLAMTVDVLTAVVECDAASRKTRTVALSALYNAITQHIFSDAISPVHSSAMRRLWTACHRLASERPGYQPRFSAASVPPTSVMVLAGGRRIEHRRVIGSTALSANVRSVSYACSPILLDARDTPEVVRVSVRIQRGFQCEALGRYYYFGLADIAAAPETTPAVQSSSISSSSVSASTAGETVRAGELTRHPGERAKQRRTYYISDYASEVPDSAIQKTDTERAKHYLNTESNIIFGSGDVVTAVVYVRERCIAFERNGLPLNVLYRSIPPGVERLYPFVELYNRDSRAKWMYAPDEAAMSARYTMRAMLLSWPNAVLPLVKECLPRFGGPPSPSASLSRSATDSASKSLSLSGHALSQSKERDSAEAQDVVLGVLGADGDEMRMVYVAPPQLDQPGGRAQAVRVERFERGMAVVSDEAGSLLRVCAAALEPDTTQEVHVTPSAALRSAVQACMPELAAFATQCLQEVMDGDVAPSSSEQQATPTATPADAAKATATTRCVLLHRPATLLRVLRLVCSLHGGAGPASAPSTATSASLGVAATTLTLAEPTERAMVSLLPLLDPLLSATQLDLPPSVLLREAWNELWCNPHLRQTMEITLPRSTHTAAAAVGEGTERHDGDSGSECGTDDSSIHSREVHDTLAEPAGITYSSSAQRFEDRLRGHRVEGDERLCPSCGQRWSACTAHHTVPSSWCDLLDRVLRRVQQQQQQQRQNLTASPKHAAAAASSPYCGWFTEWTDGPLESSFAAAETTSSSSSQEEAEADSAPRYNSGGYDLHPPADDDRAYHSPTSAQSSDAQLWGDVEDSDNDGEEAEGGAAVAAALGSEEEEDGEENTDVTSSEDDMDEDEEDEVGDEALRAIMAAAAGVAAASAASAARVESRKEHAAATSPSKEEEVPMTLVVRRAQPAKTASSSNSSGGMSDGDDTDVVYVEGSGETRQASFTFTGTLVSPTVLRGQMVFDRAELPESEREPAANVEWACPMCTFLNEPSAVRCAICANARPGASWVCPVCSYAYNTLSSSTCVTCGCMRPSSARRLHDAAGPAGYCTTCHQREHFRNFHAMRHRRFCSSCGTITRWLPKDAYSTTVEARLVGDGGVLEFQWALDGYNTVCFGLRTRAYNADALWALVDAAARRRGSSAVIEVGRCVPPIPERPLSTPSSKPVAAPSSPSSPTPAASGNAAQQPCMVGALVYYASALVLRYARLLPSGQLADPDFLRRLHVCGSDWLDSWAHFPTSAVTPVFTQCLRLLQAGVRQPGLVSTIATVALALIRQQPHRLGAEKDALLYALCLNVVRYGDAAQRKVSYGCISALMEDDPAGRLNVQPLVPVLSMEPLLEGQQRATVLALLHHASMQSTPAIAKACACMACTVEAMAHQRPLPPMLGKPFPYLVALTETRLNEGGELLVGQVRGSVGVAPTKGGKYYYEVEVPHEFVSDRSKTIVMGWGTVEHERIASAQHVGSDLHSWGFNCREHLRLMMTEQALPVPRRPNQGDVIGSMMDLETMMVCWTINGQEISWVSVPAQGDGEDIFPYVSASVEPQSVKIRLGNTRFKPAGYQDYTPPSDRLLWAEESGGAAPAPTKAGQVPFSPPPQSYEFYQQLCRALEEASITTLEDASLLSLLDTTAARSVLRQYPRLLDVMRADQPGSLPRAAPPRGAQGRRATAEEKEEGVQKLLPYIQRLRRAQELTIVVARHLSLIEKSPYLMSCYKKATDLLFSSGRWTIFELQPGGRPKYSGGHALAVLVSVRKAKRVRKEADAEWLAQHPGVVAAPTLTSSTRAVAAGAVALSATQTMLDDDDDSFGAPPPPPPVRGTAAAQRGSRSRSGSSGDARDGAEEEDEEEYVDVESGGSDDDDDDDVEDEGEVRRAGNLGRSSLAELRNTLHDVYGSGANLTPEERRLRCSVTGQLFTQLEKTRVYQRARMFAVQLEGTLAVDAGGVTRSVMSMVGEELSYRFVRGVRVDPLLPLFRLCGHSTIFTVVPNMTGLYSSEAADDGAEGGLLRRMFEWLGKLVGNMVLCGTLKVPLDFPRLLWKTLTFQEDTITLADYAYDIDDNITAALEDDEFVLSDDFFASLPEHVRASPAFLKGLHGSGGNSGGGGDGHGVEGAVHSAMASTRPLRPYVCMTPAMSMQDMSHLALEELEEFAADAEAAEVRRRRALAQEALLHQYDPAFLAMRAGLTSVVPAASLRSVRWEDLRARVCGNGAASTEHVLAELDMSPLPPSMRAMLTQVLSSFTESQLSRFLLFCSGQSRIPLPEKVLVNCGDEAGRLPTAHTCSPISLLLQPCSTAAELQNSLEACLTHAAEFGFV